MKYIIYIIYINIHYIYIIYKYYIYIYIHIYIYIYIYIYVLYLYIYSIQQEINFFCKSFRQRLSQLHIYIKILLQLSNLQIIFFYKF